jgi:hypothetical protein
MRGSFGMAEAVSNCEQSNQKMIADFELSHYVLMGKAKLQIVTETNLQENIFFSCFCNVGV